MTIYVHCTNWAIHIVTIETQLDYVNHIYKHDEIIKKLSKKLTGFLKQILFERESFPLIFEIRNNKCENYVCMYVVCVDLCIF